jgi:hypothetical protein
MLWGNDTASSQSNGAVVFDTSNGFAGVWHFKSSGSFNDATPNALNGSNSGSTDTAGAIGRGRYLNGGSYISVADHSALEPTTLTLSCWFKRNGSQSNWSKLVDKGYTGHPYPSYTLEIRDATDKAGFQTAKVNSTYKYVNTGDEISDNTWYYLTGTFNSSSGGGELYLNDVSKGTFSDNNAIEYYTSGTYNLFIGCQNGPEAYFKGSVDEVVLSKTLRSADWVKLSYQNQKSNQTLVQMGQ